MATRSLAPGLLLLLAGILAAPAPASSFPARRTQAFADPADHPRPQRMELGCGTVVTPEQAAAYLKSIRNGETPPTSSAYTPPYLVKIAPHIVRQSDGTGGLPEARYWQALADANAHFAPAQIVFFTSDPFDYIDSDAFYFDIDTLLEINDLRSTNTAPNAINVYFTEVLDYEAGSLCGISAFTFSSQQGVAFRNSCVASDVGAGDHSTFSHELGHVFDLFHTHETAFGDEYVDGSNCTSAGDLVCDTPADPELGVTNVDASTCQYTGTAVDPKNDPYVPDPSQLMSYSLKHCRVHFSPETMARAVTTLLGSRAYLINSAVDAPAISPAATDIALSAPRPNPATTLSEMQLTLPAPANVDVTVYDVRGAAVRTIAHAPFPAGNHTIGWDGRTTDGDTAAPGIYFARASVDGRTLTRKIQRLR